MTSRLRSAQAPAKARKRFGQHFLEPAWVNKLIDALQPKATDIFLEIGPGRGALTRPLARRVSRLVAVEIDRDLAAALATGESPNTQVITADFLDLDLDEVLKREPRPVRVVGNLPYNISSPILFKLLASHVGGAKVSDATVTLQREVADRLIATPGGKDYGPLAIQVSLHADVERVLALPPGAFRPPPKVSSAVVRLRFRPPAVDVGDPRTFERIVRGMFLQRRKTLRNALTPVADSFGRSAAQLLEAARIDPRRRPETLTLDEIARLTRAVL